MPRQPSPYPHRGWYVTNLGGQRHKLCREEEGIKKALTELGKLLDQRLQGRSQRYDKISVAELVGLFLASRHGQVDPLTYQTEQRYLGWLAAEYGSKQASEVTRLDAQQFYDACAKRKATSSGKPLRPGTLNKIVATLRHCWNWGHETDIVPPKNPFGKLPKLAEESRCRLVTDEEFQRLMRFAPTRLRWVFLTLRFTSMRPGELRKLTWPQIDWSNQRFVIPRHKTSKRTKTAKPRIIPFPPCVERLLRFLQRRHGHKSPYVFLNSRGMQWVGGSVLANAVKRVRLLAGIVADENGEQLVLYSNRHTYITTAASNGVDGPTLQNLAGHTNPAMTARYTHLADRHMSDAAARVTEALRPQRPASNSQPPSNKPSEPPPSKPGEPPVSQ